MCSHLLQATEKALITSYCSHTTFGTVADLFAFSKFFRYIQGRNKYSKQGDWPMHTPLIQPSCKFYYCNSINFYNGRFSFIWKDVSFYGFNGLWEPYSKSARLEGTLCVPKKLQGVAIQIEVLHDRSRGFFTLSQQSRLYSEKFSLLMIDNQTKRIHTLIARIEFINQQNMQLATSPNHKMILTRNRKQPDAWGPRVFHGLISGLGAVTIYV